MGHERKKGCVCVRVRECVSVSCRCSWTHQRRGFIDRFWVLMISLYLTGIWRDNYANYKRGCHFVWGWNSDWTCLCVSVLNPNASMHAYNMCRWLLEYDGTNVWVYQWKWDTWLFVVKKKNISLCISLPHVSQKGLCVFVCTLLKSVLWCFSLNEPHGTENSSS